MWFGFQHNVFRRCFEFLNMFFFLVKILVFFQGFSRILHEFFGVFRMGGQGQVNDYFLSMLHIYFWIFPPFNCCLACLHFKKKMTPKSIHCHFQNHKSAKYFLTFWKTRKYLPIRKKQPLAKYKFCWGVGFIDKQALT